MVYRLPSGPFPADSARSRGLRSGKRIADEAVSALPIDDAALNVVPFTHCGNIDPARLRSSRSCGPHYYYSGSLSQTAWRVIAMRCAGARPQHIRVCCGPGAPFVSLAITAPDLALHNYYVQQGCRSGSDCTAQ